LGDGDFENENDEKEDNEPEFEGSSDPVTAFSLPPRSEVYGVPIKEPHPKGLQPAIASSPPGARCGVEGDGTDKCKRGDDVVKCGDPTPI
jgi:hypothetical protein